MSVVDRQTLLDVLVFYQEAGVDAVVGEVPVDRLTEPEPAPAAAAEPRPRQSIASPRESRIVPARDRAAGNAAPPPPNAAVMAAREAARTAADLEALRAILERFEGCALRATATQLVFARGNPQARVMFVGEAPGYEEDQLGKPFVGRSGLLLDRMMAAIGLDESSAYIANIVPWRPPGNRTPTPQEAAICLPFIRRQIELADPEVLVCLGNPSAQALLNLREGITKSRGRWYPFATGSREIRALPTFHPAFLLRSPLQKRLAWRDFLTLKRALEG
ncbi:MAG: uracil-DNA glycosylase [Hyphomicrobiales bacterium]|nr:uracil-DNA glycosylase [Hyphomicrobiales bacterium]